MRLLVENILGILRFRALDTSGCTAKSVVAETANKKYLISRLTLTCSAAVIVRTTAYSGRKKAHLQDVILVDFIYLVLLHACHVIVIAGASVLCCREINNCNIMLDICREKYKNVVHRI